jgi:hypothetical protein
LNNIFIIPRVNALTTFLVTLGFKSMFPPKAVFIEATISFEPQSLRMYPSAPYFNP